MKALICDLCGGSLRMNDDSSGAVCEYCGVKYTKSSLQSKIQEIKGTVSVEGVQTKADLFLNAETYKRIKDIKKAIKVYKNITEQYPEDPCGWWELFCIKYHSNVVFTRFKWDWLLGEDHKYAMNAIKLDSSYKEKYENFVDEFIKMYGKEVHLLNYGGFFTICEMDSYLFQQEADSLQYIPKIRKLREDLLKDYENKVLKNEVDFLDTVNFKKSNIPNDYQRVLDMLIDRGIRNAQEIMDKSGHLCVELIKEDIIEYRSVKEWNGPDNHIDLGNDILGQGFFQIDKDFWKYNYPSFAKWYGELIFHRGNIIYVRLPYYDDGTWYTEKYIIRTRNVYTKEELSDISQRGKMKRRRDQGCCQYCGGNFKKILFKTKCEKCKKEKDY